MIKSSESSSASSPATGRPSARDIERRARAIWEEQGRPDGRSLEHWLAAERELTQARATAAPDRHASARDEEPAVGDPAYAPLKKRDNGRTTPAPRPAPATEVKPRPADEMQPAAKRSANPAAKAGAKPAAKSRRSTARA